MQRWLTRNGPYRQLYAVSGCKVYCCRRVFPAENVSDIISIDLGIKNLAWVHIDRNLHIKDWHLSELGKMKPYKPFHLFQLVEEFVDHLPSTDAIVLELQYHRPSKLGVGMNLRCLEAMLYGYLGRVYPVLSISSRTVQGLFHLPTGREKKRESTRLVQDMLNGDKVTGKSWQETDRKLFVSEYLSAMFRESTKKDDLADCLLLALAFFHLTKKVT